VVARNLALTGHPVALAAHNVALKFGDHHGGAGGVRATLSTDAPRVDSTNSATDAHVVAGKSEVALWSGAGCGSRRYSSRGMLYTFARRRRATPLGLHGGAGGAAALAGGAPNSGESERLAAVWLAPLVMISARDFSSCCSPATRRLRNGRAR